MPESFGKEICVGESLCINKGAVVPLVKKLVLQIVNHPTRLMLLFVSEILLAGAAYALFEDKSFDDGVWWAVVTACTVGYGDQFPVTGLGRATGYIVMFVNIFIIAPCVISWVISHVLEDRDEWSHEEQEAMKAELRAVITKLSEVFNEVDGVEEALAADDGNEASQLEMIRDIHQVICPTKQTA